MASNKRTKNTNRKRASRGTNQGGQGGGSRHDFGNDLPAPHFASPAARFDDR